tara:strand:+ start:1885 stop:2118 length:234 start_codon:yes stop_codon:yes gene_type:complete
MQHSWFGHLPTEDQDARKSDVNSNTFAWGILKEILERKLEVSTPDYDKHSWAFRQAHQNGRNQAIRELINLLELKGL